MLSRVIKDVIHQEMRDRMIKVKVLSEEPFNVVSIYLSISVYSLLLFIENYLFHSSLFSPFA
jgi:hypothetical protein